MNCIEAEHARAMDLTAIRVSETAPFDKSNIQRRIKSLFDSLNDLAIQMRSLVLPAMAGPFSFVPPGIFKAIESPGVMSAE